jgi:hypothetical protein
MLGGNHSVFWQSELLAKVVILIDFDHVWMHTSRGPGILMAPKRNVKNNYSGVDYTWVDKTPSGSGGLLSARLLARMPSEAASKSI